MPLNDDKGPKSWTEWAHETGDTVDYIKEKLVEMEKTQLQYMNGKFTSLKDSVEQLRSEHEEHSRQLKDLSKRLVDPDDGLVVRVRANESFKKKVEAVEGIDTLKDLKKIQSRFNTMF